MEQSNIIIYNTDDGKVKVILYAKDPPKELHPSNQLLIERAVETISSHFQ